MVKISNLEILVFPAHAGMSLLLTGTDGRPVGFPRPRGDEP